MQRGRAQSRGGKVNYRAHAIFSRRACDTSERSERRGGEEETLCAQKSAHDLSANRSFNTVSMSALTTCGRNFSAKEGLIE